MTTTSGFADGTTARRRLRRLERRRRGGQRRRRRPSSRRSRSNAMAELDGESVHRLPVQPAAGRARRRRQCGHSSGRASSCTGRRAARSTPPSTPVRPPDRGASCCWGPSRRAAGGSFAAEIVDLIDVHDITGVVFVGAMLADVPHTRPISIFVGSENEGVRTELASSAAPTRGRSASCPSSGDAVEAAGIPTLSIWASVPHYVHNAPSPKATLALIDKLDELERRGRSPGANWTSESTAWESGIDALAADDEDMAGYIEQLEQARDTVDSPEASARRSRRSSSATSGAVTARATARPTVVRRAALPAPLIESGGADRLVGGRLGSSSAGVARRARRHRSRRRRRRPPCGPVARACRARSTRAS